MKTTTQIVDDLWEELVNERQAQIFQEEKERELMEMIYHEEAILKVGKIRKRKGIFTKNKSNGKIVQSHTATVRADFSGTNGHESDLPF